MHSSVRCSIHGRRSVGRTRASAAVAAFRSPAITPKPMTRCSPQPPQHLKILIPHRLDLGGKRERAIIGRLQHLENESRTGAACRVPVFEQTRRGEAGLPPAVGTPLIRDFRRSRRQGRALPLFAPTAGEAGRMDTAEPARRG